MKSTVLSALGTLFLGLFCTLSAAAQEENRWITKDIRDIAHRGGDPAPEETMMAIRTAYRNGAPAIAVDFQLTLDNKLILMHDETVDRTTNGTGKVRDMTLAEIQALDAGYQFTLDGGKTFPFRGLGVRVPELWEVFRFIWNHDYPVMLRFKGGMDQIGAVYQACILIDQLRIGHLINFATRDQDVMREIQTYANGNYPWSRHPRNAVTTCIETFNVLSYNVAGLPNFLSESSPRTFTPMISPLLNTYDLVLVQEDFSYHEELSSQANHPYQSTPGQEPLLSVSNDGLNRFSTFAMTSFTRQKWDDWHGFFRRGNDGMAPKGFSFARHELQAGVFIDVYNLHADAGDTKGDAMARGEQVEQLLRFMQTYSSGNAVIVAGDTNMVGYDPEDEPVLHQLLTGAGLTDAARYLGAPECIDRILYRSSSSVQLEAASYQIAPEFIDATGNPLSDHDAIHVEMNWTLLP